MASNFILNATSTSEYRGTSSPEPNLSKLATSFWKRRSAKKIITLQIPGCCLYTFFLLEHWICEHIRFEPSNQWPCLQHCKRWYLLRQAYTSAVRTPAHPPCHCCMKENSQKGKTASCICVLTLPLRFCKIPWPRWGF